jgi:hypothetical protein
LKYDLRRLGETLFQSEEREKILKLKKWPAEFTKNVRIRNQNYFRALRAYEKFGE